MRADNEGAAVMFWSGIVAAFQGIPSGLVSIGVGLWGVVLARWVFVNRENRRLPRHQSWHETLPLTLVAMLITTVLVHDRQFGISVAAFTGLGVGWAAVLLLDVLGERITAAFRAGFAMPPPTPIETLLDRSGHKGEILPKEKNTPPDMAKLIDKIDEGKP